MYTFNGPGDFNGFEDLVLSMYNSFDPHLKIISSEGKTFNPESVQDKLLDNNDIDALPTNLSHQKHVFCQFHF